MSGGGNLGFGGSRKRSSSRPVGGSPQELIPFSQGTLGGGGPGSFNDVLFELNRSLQENPALTAASGQFGQAEAGLDALEAAPDPRGALLRELSLTTTDRAASAGSLFAREAGAGRGGLAFGTGAGEIARRSAADAAGGQSQALSQAVLGAEQLKEDRSRFLTTARGQLGGARLGEAQFIASRRERALNARQQFLQLMAQIAASGTTGIGGAAFGKARGSSFQFSVGGKGGSSSSGSSGGGSLF